MKQPGSFLFRLAPAIVLIALLPACRPAEVGPDKPRVALVMKSLANEFFKTMEDGAKAFAQEHSGEFDLIVNGTQNEEDVAGQVSIVEQMMTQSVDAIVIAPADSKALVAVLERAQKQGIVVVNIDNRLDTELLEQRGMRVPFVGPNNREGARRAAEYLAARLTAGDAVAILEGMPSAYNAIQRKQGFEDGMRAGGMKIVSSQSANWELSKANQVAAGILSEHPETKALLCANDSMALGAIAAVRQASRGDQVQVIGFDNIAAVQDLIRTGEILCTIDQHGDRLAEFGIAHALRMIDDGAAPGDQETPVDLVTLDTLSGAAVQ